MDFQLVKNQTGLPEAQCLSAAWSEGVAFIDFLKRRFAATVVDRAEGPDARVWKLQIEGKAIKVNQWDTGDLSVSVEERGAGELISKIVDCARELEPTR